jgi:hypothetical protein
MWEEGLLEPTEHCELVGAEHVCRYEHEQIPSWSCPQNCFDQHGNALKWGDQDWAGNVQIYGYEWEHGCPTECYEADGTTIMKDTWGNYMFNHGKGCPQRCYIDDNPSKGRLTDDRGYELIDWSGAGCPYKCPDPPPAAVDNWYDEWAYPPGACSIFCTQDNGDLMMPGGWPITVQPVVWGQGSETSSSYESTTTRLSDEDAQNLMCPVKCGDDIQWPPWNEETYTSQWTQSAKDEACGSDQASGQGYGSGW